MSCLSFETFFTGDVMSETRPVPGISFRVFSKRQNIEKMFHGSVGVKELLFFTEMRRLLLM